ncbi:MAG: glycerol kinase GlpK [Anaerofustis stercorihominis]|nr:glycerol kinase GlpK [Anaerofustis stercorihominis]
MKYIIALDQGTTSCRSIVFDEKFNMIAMSQKEFTQIYPHPTWVEHDGEEILSTQIETLRDVIKKAKINTEDILSVGITNQRESTIIWNRETGKPVYNSIVWQCRRTADYCDELEASGYTAYIKETTGLTIDAYFSATKIKWILDNVEGAREDALKGKLAFGTMDSWLIYNLSGGKYHITDYTNASRTMLYDINNLCWDEKLMSVMDIPSSLMPCVVPSSGQLAYIDESILGRKIPITGIAGDQQSALFGQNCVNFGEVKNTYGTGCFLLANTLDEKINSTSGLVTTLACKADGSVCYALEGSVFIAGALIQWLRDEMGLLTTAAESEKYANMVDSSDGVYIVPAFSGLGAPHWDMRAKAVIVGLSRGSNRNHLIRASLEAIAYQLNDLMQALNTDLNAKAAYIKADGGASANDLLMQLTADMADTDVIRPKNIESTALGAAMLAAIGIGLYNSTDEMNFADSTDRVFTPSIDKDKRNALLKGWNEAVRMCISHD